MTERSKQIFGNDIAPGAYKKAVRSKQKFIRKFGDDSTKIYPTSIQANPYIGPELGVSDIRVGEEGTADFNTEKGIIVGNIRMGFGHYRISMAIASAASWAVQYFILEPLGLGYMQTIAFILVIATLVQFVEMFMKKAMPSLYSALGIFLPLITTNCAVLGAAKTNISNSYSFIGSLVYGVAAGVGYTLAIVLFASIRERLDATSKCPKCFEGFPISLVAAALLAMSFMGFSGLSIW